MDEWLMLFKRVLRTPGRAVTNSKLFLYFLFTVCVFGAAGAWIPALQMWFEVHGVTELIVRRNLATYAIGVAITALADCVVRRSDKDDGAFRLLVLGLAVISAVSASIVLLVDSLQRVRPYSTWGAILAALVWLMVNDAHPDLTKGDAFSTLGGRDAH